MQFDYQLDFSSIDFRKHPELYRIGKGEQGVLLVEPYKSEILPHWKFKSPPIARKSANRIYRMFLEYKAKEEFVGMDMARKFLQMGYTRSRRYANHKSGRKYVAGSKEVLPRDEDTEKAESAKIFYEKWQQTRKDKKYLQLTKRHREIYEKYSGRFLRERSKELQAPQRRPGSAFLIVARVDLLGARTSSQEPADPPPRTAPLLAARRHD